MKVIYDNDEFGRRRLGWRIGLVVLACVLAGPLALVVMRRGGGQELVKLTEKSLSPAERVKELKEARAEFAAPTVIGDGRATLKGTLHAPGGEPMTKPVPASSIIRTGNGTTMASLPPLKDTFSIEVNSGKVWLSLTPEEFAPVMAGPFEARPGATVEGIDVVFEPGFPARVRVVDENGAPVAGARVQGGLVVDGGSIYSASGLVTDGDGFVTVAHAARGPYRMAADAPGFQTPELTPDVTLTPAEATVLTLVHAHPARGVVVGPGGAPVAGAKLRVFAKSSPHRSRQYGTTAPVMATTDKDGRFSLDALDDDWSYDFLVETDQLGRRLVKGVRAGSEDLKWTVGPDLTITGTIKGDVTALEKERGKPVVEVTQRGRKEGPAGDMRGALTRTTVPVERVEGGGGRFKVTGVLPGEVVVAAGEHVVQLDVEKPDNPVTIDLTGPAAKPARREVILRIVTPEGADWATGSVVGFATDASVERVYQPYEQPIKGGEARLEVTTPGRVGYQARAAIGYWFKDGDIEVPPGDQPLVVVLKGVPAGAILGRVLDADGSPAVDVSLGVSVVEKPPALKPDEFVQLNNVSVDSGGRFFLGPLPIGGTYVAVAGRGHNRQVSKAVRLDSASATGRVEIRMARPVAAGGRVVGPDGRPVAGVEVSLRLEHPQAGTNWSPPTPTDREGRFRFDDLNPELGPYKVSIDARKDYVPVDATLNPGGPPVEIKLEPGHVVTGRVVDAKTGWPIPGVEVHATRKQVIAGGQNWFSSEATTDEQGRFRFSDLPAGLFQLNDQAGLRWESDKVRDVSADQAGAVEVRATLPDWSTLKPVAPPGK